MISWLEKSLVLRKLSARFVTFLKSNKKAKDIVRRSGLSGDVWEVKNPEEKYKELYDKYSVNFSELIAGKKDPIGLIALPEDAINESFIKACDELGLSYVIFNPLSEKFIEQVKSSDINKFLVKISHKTQIIRQLFLEKVEIIVNDMGKSVYPSLKEQKIYEAKRTLSYFLQANNVPHPKTWVFYDKKEALTFAKTAPLPLVFKTHNGAGASGVEILKTRRQVINCIKTCFDGYYLNKSITDYRDIDYGYILFQEYIRGAREHRIIKVGDSWIGHEKALNDNSEFMSGSGVNLWARPSNRILDFCREIAEKHDFNTMCFDIFEDETGRLYVNELQTWFGSYNPSQMYIDGVPGRLIYERGEYVFQEGLFNHNRSVNLRLTAMLNKQ